ncbi:MAG: polyprenyl synthetase family protein [Geminicoccaceae bacterium]
MDGPALERALRDHAAAVEGWLDHALPRPEGATATLVRAMRHAALGGGKRLRAFLVKATGDLFGVPAEQSLAVGGAIELLHAYSLVHDDLPAMDDAAMRRGRPSCHKAFDEATAILAGDALQALAFELLADGVPGIDDATSRALVLGLGRAGGAAGMCGGQMIDLEAGSLALDLAGIRELQALKTGALIRFSCEAGCLLGRASDDDRQALLAYGERLGLAFQISDDLLDLRGDPVLVGKDVGHDADQGKATFITALGLDGAEAELRRLRGRRRPCLPALPDAQTCSKPFSAS